MVRRVLAALVARQAKREAESDDLDLEGEFDDNMDEDEMIEDDLEDSADEDEEPFDPMCPPTPELVMTE